MGLFQKLQIAGTPTIDWEMTPEYTFGTFESWGGVERVRSKNERIYYFFVDAWGDTPKLCLMERGIKHARVVAEILAPADLVEACVNSQGKVALFERTHAIDQNLKDWLLENVIETNDDSKIIPIVEEVEVELGPSGLPGSEDFSGDVEMVALPDQPGELSEEGLVGLIEQFDLVDHERNAEGGYEGILVDNGDQKTVLDRKSGLMWQREGMDINSYRSMCRAVEQLNKDSFAGYSDWRLPTPAEALSLMLKEKNSKDQFIHPCFSASQPFIFVDAVRKPGGYWFVDYKHGRAFWASGTIPGGFGRVCRREK